MITQICQHLIVLRGAIFREVTFNLSWADRVKLARTGGELNSMAIRIARAATGKDKIAIWVIMVGMIGI